MASLHHPGIAGHAVAADLPNILMLIADDAGWRDLGCYGHPTIRTPHVDELASQGLRFTHAFVTSPQCSPSRSSIWTGKYAHATGTEDLHTPLPAGQPLLPDWLRAHGYFSGNVGKLHLGRAARGSFDFTAQSVQAWRQFMQERPSRRPFLLCLGFLEPHRPYRRSRAGGRYGPEDVVVPPYLPDTAKVRADLTRYYTAISRMDDEIGEVLRALRHQDLEEATLVVFLSDNGLPFPRAKGCLYDPGIAVPLIMSWLKGLPTGLRSGQASLLDLAPTLLEAAGLQVPEGTHGESFWPRVMNGALPGREYVFTERNWHDLDDHVRAVRTGRYKYIRNDYFDEPHALPADIYVSPSYRALRARRRRGQLPPEQAQILANRRPQHELYDLHRDPDEFHNLAELPEYRPIMEALQRRLGAWSEETDDVSPLRRRRGRALLRLLGA